MSSRQRTSLSAVTPQLIQTQLTLQYMDKAPQNIFGKTDDFSITRKAAVLIPLFREDQQWHVLFIRRTHKAGDIHSGQVAFPGGAEENGDKNFEETALRETCEEIGVCENTIEVLGKMSPMLTISNFLVTPIVGLLAWPQKLTASEEEVSKIFSIPLQWLVNKSNHQVRTRSLANGKSLSVIYFDAYQGEILWGASARIMRNFIQILNLD